MNVERIAILTGHKGSVYTIEAGTENNIFYSGSGDGMIVRWDIQNPSEAHLIAKVNSNIFSLALLPQSDILLAGQMQGGIHVLDIIQKKELRLFAAHAKGIFDIQVKNEQVFVAGGDGTLSIWDLNTLNLIRLVKISDSSLRSISFHPELELMAVGCSDNNIYIMTVDNCKVIYDLSSHANSVFCVKYSPDGRYLLTGSRDAHLNVWNAQKNYELYARIPGHNFTINSIAYRQDGRFFATASRDKMIKIWDAASFDLLKVIDKERFEAHSNSVNKIIWSGDNNYLISCSDDRSIMVWEIREF